MRIPKPTFMDVAAHPEQYPLTGAFLAGRLRDRLNPDNLAHLEAFASPSRLLADGQYLVERGAPVDAAHVLVDGYMFSVVEKGGDRFIVGVHVPGDMVDLHGFALKRLDHDVVAAGSARVSQISHEALSRIMAERPALAEALWASTLLTAAIHRRWIHNLEALDASRRIAHLFAELHYRQRMTGRAGARTLRTPFTQTDLADMCGVSAIHANRAIGRLRDMGLAEIRRGDLYTSDWKALEDYAGFDPGYLYAGG